MTVVCIWEEQDGEGVRFEVLTSNKCFGRY